MVIFFFDWHYNPLWVLAFTVILYHSSLSLHWPLHRLIPVICVSSSISTIHLLLGLHLILIPLTTKTILSTYADDKAIMTTHSNPTIASMNLQTHLRKIEEWKRKWRLKINETKSAHITFTLRKGTCPPLYINQSTIPQTDTVNP